MSNIYIEIGDLVKIKNFDNYFKVIRRYADGSIRTVETNASDVVYHDIYCKEDIVEVKIPCQYKTIYKREEPILDDKEKEYLSAVIKPFRDRVKTISKKRAGQDFIYEYIEIGLPNDDYAYLPNFKTATMYKGMKLNKKYTLKELGL